MIWQARFQYAFYMCLTYYVVTTPDMASGLHSHLVCPDNYTLDVNHSRCVSTFGDTADDASLHLLANQHFNVTPQIAILILGVAIGVVSMSIILLTHSLVRKGISRWMRRGNTSVVSGFEASGNYERLDYDKSKDMKVSTILLLTGTPFYEVDTTQRMIGLRGNII